MGLLFALICFAALFLLWFVGLICWLLTGLYWFWLCCDWVADCLRNCLLAYCFVFAGCWLCWVWVDWCCLICMILMTYVCLLMNAIYFVVCCFVALMCCVLVLDFSFVDLVWAWIFSFLRFLLLCFAFSVWDILRLFWLYVFRLVFLCFDAGLVMIFCQLVTCLLLFVVMSFRS